MLTIVDILFHVSDEDVSDSSGRKESKTENGKSLYSCFDYYFIHFVYYK